MDALYEDTFGFGPPKDDRDQDSDDELDAQYGRGSALRCDECRYEPKICRYCRLKLKQHGCLAGGGTNQGTTEKKSALERVSASLQTRPQPVEPRRTETGRAGWWSLWNSEPPALYHAEVRSRGAEPLPSTQPTHVRTQPPQARTQRTPTSYHAPCPPSQERGAEIWGQAWHDPVEPHGWNRSRESWTTETRTTTRQTRSFGGHVDVREDSTVYRQSSASRFDSTQLNAFNSGVRFPELDQQTQARFHGRQAHYNSQVWQGPQQRRAPRSGRQNQQRSSQHYRRRPASGHLQTPETTPSARPSPYEQHFVRSIDDLPYRGGTGHAVGLGMWYLWTLGPLESRGAFEYKRVVLQCAGPIGFAETTLSGCLSDRVSTWRVLCWVVFLEWPKLLLEITSDVLQGLVSNLCGTAEESRDVD